MPPAETLLLAATALAAALTVGALVSVTTLLPPAVPAWRRAVRLAGGAAAVWAVAALALVAVSTPLPRGASLADPSSGAAVAASAVGTGAPLALGAVGAAAIATATAVWVRAPLRAAWALVLAVLAAAPVGALVGVAVGASVGAGPGAAVGVPGGASGVAAVLAGSPGATARLAGWLFLVGAGAWVGSAGAGVLRTARSGPAGRPVVLRRSRTLAWWAAATALVAVAGGLLAAARGGPPSATGGGAVTGAPPPPLPLTAWRAAVQVSPDLLWLVLAAAGLTAYLLVARTAGPAPRPGPRAPLPDRQGLPTVAPWPRARTLAWCAGWLVTVWVTSGGLAAYTSLLLSAQLVAHAVLLVLAAPLLVLGAPLELAGARSVPREDGSAGLRECVAALSHTRPALALRHPAVALGGVVAVLWAVYATSLLPSVLGTLAGHELATAAVLGAGTVAARAVLAAPRALAVGVLAAAAVGAAGAGTWLATTERLLAAGWFSRLGLGVDALADQRAGGLLAAATVVAGCAAWGLLAPAVVTVRARRARGGRAGTR